MIIKKDILYECVKNDFLLEKDILGALLELNNNFYISLIKSLKKMNLNEKIINKKLIIENKEKIEQFLENKEKIKQFKDFLIKNNIENKNFDKKRIKIILDTKIVNKKMTVDDFVKFFNNRYEQIKDILQKEKKINPVSIRRMYNSDENQYVIVIISDKKITKNKNIIFFVEDSTGMSKIIINFNKEDLYNKCKNITLDDVVAFNVKSKGDLLFANDVVLPSLVSENRKIAKNEDYAVFVSDVHIGSNLFLEKNFLNFLNWINGNFGTEEEKNIAKNIKYIFFIGDNVDGVGVFPGQEKTLNILDIKEQYKKFAKFLSLIKKDINIVILPGQHDSPWIGEPQEKINKKWAQDLYNLENVSLVSNPCFLEIENNIKILLYHGASFHSIVENIPDLKQNIQNPTEILKELLKKRHIAPLYGSSDYIVNKEKDFLVLNDIPDIIATGDSHVADFSSFNDIILISSSCWQSKTPFEEKIGKNPTPCNIPILNLKTREVKILDFSN